MTLEEKMRDYIKRAKIPISVVSRESGVPYMALYRSLSGKRRLLAKGFLAVCLSLSVDPLKFAEVVISSKE